MLSPPPWGGYHVLTCLSPRNGIAVSILAGYPESMQIIPVPDHGQLLLVVTPYVAGEAVFDLTARLALAGDLEVIDGGNTFNAYNAVHALRRVAPELPGAARLLERVRSRVISWPRCWRRWRAQVRQRMCPRQRRFHLSRCWCSTCWRLLETRGWRCASAGGC